MWNDGVFPSLSSPNTSFAGDSESRIRSSNTFTELERHYSVDIFTTPQDSDCFQLGSFPPPLSPPTGLSATPLDSTPGEGDVLTATAAANLRPSTMTLIQPNSVAGCNKRMASSDSISKRTASTQASKRLKTAEKLHQPPSNESASTHPQLMKAPVRRSQKLGDKITALQQLVSPFGKTDTASVLHEATICIKFLHEQIQVLTAPYFRITSSPHLPAEPAASDKILIMGLGGLG
ncbi:transcription factor bHLH111-like [Cocos nucifera]|nr:transcription factor bHLH111-like [Cocos nucifera]